MYVCIYRLITPLLEIASVTLARELKHTPRSEFINVLGHIQRVVELGGTVDIDLRRMAQDAQTYCRDVDQRLRNIAGLIDGYITDSVARSSEKTIQVADAVARDLSSLATETTTNMNRMASVLSGLDRLQVWFLLHNGDKCKFAQQRRC